MKLGMYITSGSWDRICVVYICGGQSRVASSGAMRDSLKGRIWWWLEKNWEGL